MLEVEEEDLPETFRLHDLLREGAAGVRVLDALPIPDVAELLVLDLAEKRPVSHHTPKEEPGVLELAAIEKEKRRWDGEVLAARIGLELARGLVRGAGVASRAL
jgi:hypothetical protein